MNLLKPLRVVFMGTPDFAVASLKTMVEANINIVGVVTALDKPAGRGMHLHTSAVKDYALLNNLRILQPEKLKSPDFVNELKSLEADLFVVVAFRMLPEIVWNMPALGTVNVHASLLPKYRGAAPINHAIINGETETGVTIFKLKKEIDTGNILSQQKIPILNSDNAGTLHDKLMLTGAELLLKTIEEMVNDTIKEIPQDDIIGELIQYAPKFFSNLLYIDWNQPVKKIHNFIRGLSPYPTAHAMLGDKLIKIYGSHYVIEEHNEAGGSFQILHHHNGNSLDSLRFAALDGWIYIDELKLEGKKRLLVADFIRGYRK